jgi:phosphate transport system substrate-binding protein
MSKNRFVILLALLLLVVVPFVSVSAQDQTLAEVIAANPNLSTLAGLVDAAGLTETLGGGGPNTVFAPTNEAFAAVPQIALDYLVANPDALTALLTYHVAPGSIPAANITENVLVDTLNSAQLDVKVGDAGVSVNGFHVTQSDIAASNGVIHIIDGVLIPPQALPEVTPAVTTGDIAIDGSSTVEPLTVALADQFTADGYSGNITVGESGTGGGFEAFCSELTIDIADASRAIRTGDGEEQANCIANGRTPIAFRVGTDGIAIVVNPANDFATDLTSEEIAALFSTAVNWSDVRADFPAEPIIRYIPGTDSGTYDFFVETFYEDEGAGVQAASELNQSENDNVLVQGVEGNQFAVGFFGYAYYQANADSLKVLAIDGISPTADSVESGAYALSRPLFIYSDPTIMQEKPQVADFINYYLTNVNNLIDAVGYFPASDQALNAAGLWYLAAVNAAS